MTKQVFPIAGNISVNMHIPVRLTKTTVANNISVAHYISQPQKIAVKHAA